MRYRAMARRKPDNQYRRILRKILRDGDRVHNRFQKKGRISCLTTPNMVFDLRNGFPIITERNIEHFWRKPIAELICFAHGTQTLEEMKAIGGKDWPNWWARWLKPEKCAQFGLPGGDMGPGSYKVMGKYPMPDGSFMNQFEAVLDQMSNRPSVTTHKITPWVPYLAVSYKGRQRQVVVAPCHGDIQMHIVRSGLYLRMDQRSGDMPIGVPSNMIQYAALTLMIAQVLNLRPMMFIHSVHDAHIYTDQVAHVKRLLRRKPKPFPTVRINDPSIKDFFAFRSHHFSLSHYNPHPAMNDIPVTE